MITCHHLLVKQNGVVCESSSSAAVLGGDRHAGEPECPEFPICRLVGKTLVREAFLVRCHVFGEEVPRQVANGLQFVVHPRGPSFCGPGCSDCG